MVSGTAGSEDSEMSLGCFFPPLHFSVLPVSGFWVHSLPADVFPFCGDKHGGQQLLQRSPSLLFLGERKACSSSVCMKLAPFGSCAYLSVGLITGQGEGVSWSARLVSPIYSLTQELGFYV